MVNEQTISLICCGTDEKDYYFEIASTMLLATPTWEPESEPVPLSLSEAIEISIPHARRQRARFDSCVCVRVALMSVEQRLKSSYWFYHLEFAPVMDGRIYGSDQISVVLLLDGTVVEPRVTDRNLSQM